MFIFLTAFNIIFEGIFLFLVFFLRIVSSEIKHNFNIWCLNIFWGWLSHRKKLFHHSTINSVNNDS